MNQQFIASIQRIPGSTASGPRRTLEEFNLLHLAFHKSLYDAAGVSHLWLSIQQKSGHVDCIRRLHLPIGNKASQIIRDHSEIVRMIAKQAPPLAQTAMRNHLSRSLAFSHELRSQFPKYFAEGK